MSGGVIGFASRGNARADVDTCITLLIIDDDEVCKLRVCLARLDSLDMEGDAGKGKLLGFKRSCCMSGIVWYGMGGGEDTCMLVLGRPWAWGAGIGGWEGEVMMVGLGEVVEANAGD